MRWLVLLLALLLGGIVLFNAVVYTVRARVVRGLPDCDAVDALGWLDAAWCFAQECLATLLVVGAIPLGWVGSREPQQASVARGPVVLVHGWGLNSGSMLWLRRRLQRDGWGPVSCFAYASRQANIEAAAAELRKHVDAAWAASPQPLTLIGHSLGGLVLRYYVRRYAARGVRRLVTLGTPHRGTLLARPWLPRLAPEAPLLANLNAADRTPQQLDVIAIYSTFDAIVLPPSSGAYDGAFSIQLNNVGHNALLTSKRVYALIAENLAVPMREPGY